RDGHPRRAGGGRWAGPRLQPRPRGAARDRSRHAGPHRRPRPLVPPMRVVVVGGGITGLAAAWFLRDRADVTVLEASHRAGGKIRTDDFDGIAVESGPDAFLARVPEAIALCRELGLDDELVAPAAGEAYLWTRGRLRRLPAGLMLGVPTGLVGLARSGIL